MSWYVFIYKKKLSEIIKLAKMFKLAGGNIKNIIVNAVFLAADDSGVITMEHVIRAAKREFQRIGKVLWGGGK